MWRTSPTDKFFLLSEKFLLEPPNLSRMAYDTPRNKAGTGRAPSEGMETSGSHGSKKQKLQGHRTTNADSTGAHRPDQRNLDLEMVSRLYTHRSICPVRPFQTQASTAMRCAAPAGLLRLCSFAASYSKLSPCSRLPLGVSAWWFLCLHIAAAAGPFLLIKILQ